MRKLRVSAFIDVPSYEFPLNSILFDTDEDEATAQDVIDELQSEVGGKWTVFQDVLDGLDESHISLDFYIVEDGSVVSQAEWA